MSFAPSATTDALFQYDEKYQSKEKAGKSISEVIQEAKTMVEEPVINEEEPKTEEIIEEPQA